MKIQNKERMIHFRATPSEKADILRQAKKLGLRLSSYVRNCVMTDMEARKEDPFAKHRLIVDDISDKWNAEHGRKP